MIESENVNMLKQIGVRLEQDMIKKVKMLAIEQEISIQDVFKDALDSYFINKLTIKQTNKITSKHDNKLESEKANIPTKEIVFDSSDYCDENGNIIEADETCTMIDESLPTKQPTLEDFYGKIEEPDNSYYDPMEELKNTPEEKPKKAPKDSDEYYKSLGF